MKKLLFIFFVVLLPSVSKAQSFGDLYTWVETFTATTTAKDTLFPTRYESADIFFVGGTGSIKIAAPDTNGFSSKTFIPLVERQILSTGPQTRLLRVSYKSSSGSITMYIVGTKLKRQF